jgi:GrpB-like predicted nucleotidyltransferase (UPF0157 family)
VVVPYDPAWPLRFADEAQRITDALGALLDGPVEHIGSTSIPGIDAKPIIDMLAPVRSPDDALAAAGRLTGLGYAVRPHRVDAVRLVKPDTDEVRAVTHHLHLTTTTSELWRERLAFRDAVRADDALRAEYAALKHRLLDQAGGAVYPAEGKRAFVRRVLAGAGVELRDGRHADGR